MSDEEHEGDIRSDNKGHSSNMTDRQSKSSKLF